MQIMEQKTKSSKVLITTVLVVLLLIVIVGGTIIIKSKKEVNQLSSEYSKLELTVKERDSLVNDFVNLNSDEIYRKVGDYGLKFSGGQIIRIGIARALYRRGITLYIFDEITSGLDHNTSLKLLKNINMFLSNTIVIYVSHNINLYSEFNTVINLNDLN